MESGIKRVNILQLPCERKIIYKAHPLKSINQKSVYSMSGGIGGVKYLLLYIIYILYIVI
jgi:hypothetical protein